MARPSRTVTHLSPEELEAASRPTLGRIARLLNPYRRQILAVMGIVVLAAGISALVPFLTRAVFDDALFVEGGPRMDLLGWLVAGMIALPIIAALLGIAQNWLTSNIGNSAMADLRSDLFAHLQKLELAFFTGTKTGAIQSRLANDVAGVRNVLTDTATAILQNSVTVLAALISMIVLSWQLTILTVIIMPLFIWLQRRVGVRRQVLARKTQENLSEMTAITEESLSVSGILLSKAFNRGTDEAARYRRANKEQTQLQVQQAMTGRLFFAIVQTFFAITPALIYLVSGFIITGSFPGGPEALTAGTLVAFTTVQARLQMPLLQLMRVSLDVQTSLALFRRIFEYQDLVPSIVDSPDAINVSPENVRGEIEFRNVWFQYPEPRQLSGGGHSPRFGLIAGASPAAEEAPAGEQWILRDVSLSIKAGSMAAIIGPSGSGKTTMTYLVPRFHEVTRGQVLIDGIDRGTAGLNDLAPEDIESFSVLKDASATAIYGARGANGVILVNTRRGEDGKITINANFKSSMETLPRLPEYLNAYDYAVLANEARVVRGGLPVYSPEIFDIIKYGMDPDLFPDVNWQKEILRERTWAQQGNINISGGGKLARYYMSLFYRTNDA
ncbi:MAG: ATP-binding cassette domain-containing protein, partial [Actinomycetales bacterium]|nr:ATP-binding cassette domain-containing protein [Actinomycetales bacterium]